MAPAITSQHCSPTLKEALALFTVQPSTSWLQNRASLMALAMTFERDTRTVKQVTIPVHGASINLMVLTP